MYIVLWFNIVVLFRFPKNYEKDSVKKAFNCLQFKYWYTRIDDYLVEATEVKIDHLIQQSDSEDEYSFKVYLRRNSNKANRIW